jgi:hypothetical protein
MPAFGPVDENTILIVGPSWVGDMVMAQSLFTALVSQRPRCCHRRSGAGLESAVAGPDAQGPCRYRDAARARAAGACDTVEARPVAEMMALKEALDTGYDEALLLDANGFVMEGSGENTFIVRDGVLHTPGLTSALDGITRRTVIQLAEEEGLKVVERRITTSSTSPTRRSLTGTAAEVAPIREVDGRVVGSGSR